MQGYNEEVLCIKELPDTTLVNLLFLKVFIFLTIKKKMV